MDEVRIWTVQRTQAELQAGMFSELTGNEPGLALLFEVQSRHRRRR